MHEGGIMTVKAGNIYQAGQLAAYEDMLALLRAYKEEGRFDIPSYELLSWVQRKIFAIKIDKMSKKDYTKVKEAK